MIRAIFKPADEDRLTTSATADADLQFPLEANAVYAIRGVLTFRSSTTADAKNGFQCTATLARGSGYGTVTDPAYPETSDAGSPSCGPFDDAYLTAGSTKAFSMLSGSNWASVRFSILLETSSTGTFSVVWAQNASDTDPCTLLAGSMLTYEKLT